MFSKRIRKAFQILINEKSFPINEQNTALVVIDGKLIEKPVLREMYRVLSIADRV